jgi:hypothetical protein
MQWPRRTSRQSVKDKPCNDQEGQAVSRWRTNNAMTKKDKPSVGKGQTVSWWRTSHQSVKDKPSVGEGQTMQWPRTNRQSVKDKPCNDQEGQVVSRWRTNHAMTKDKPSLGGGQTMQWPKRTNRQSLKDKPCNDQEGQTVSRRRTNNAMIKKDKLLLDHCIVCPSPTDGLSFLIIALFVLHRLTVCPSNTMIGYRHCFNNHKYVIGKVSNFFHQRLDLSRRVWRYQRGNQNP